MKDKKAVEKKLDTSFEFGGDITRSYDVNINSGVGTYAKGGEVSLTKQVKNYIDTLGEEDLISMRNELGRELDKGIVDKSRFKDELAYLNYRIGKSMYAKGGITSQNYQASFSQNDMRKYLGRRLTSNEREQLAYINELVEQANEYSYAINNQNENDLIPYRDMALKQAYIMVDNLQIGKYK